MLALAMCSLQVLSLHPQARKLNHILKVSAKKDHHKAVVLVLPLFNPPAFKVNLSPMLLAKLKVKHLNRLLPHLLADRRRKIVQVAKQNQNNQLALSPATLSGRTHNLRQILQEYPKHNLQNLQAYPKHNLQNLQLFPVCKL
jgi:hypothetical protein